MVVQEMNCRQRVIAAASHCRPDRVPVGLSFAGQAWRSLELHLKLKGADLSEWIGNDFWGVEPQYPNRVSTVGYSDPTIEVTDDGLYVDIYRVPFRKVDTEFQTYVDIAGRPVLNRFAGRTSVEMHLRDVTWE